MGHPFKRAASDGAATYALYGKLPNRADFVRVNANHPVITEFDDLIQRTFERLTVQEDWTQKYDRSGPVDFQYVSADSRYTLIGVLAPSRDLAGRRYPLVAGAILPAEASAGHAHIAPLAHEVFFDGLREQVMSAVDNSVEALSCREFLDSQLPANAFAAADLALARSVAERFMRTASVARLNDLLLADARSTTLEQALLNLAFYRAFLRRFDNRATNHIILLPIPNDQGEHALIACAWLSMLDALWQGRGDKQPWRGNYSIAQRASGTVTLSACFGKAHEAFTTSMLASDPDPAVLLDLCNEQDAWRNHRLYAEVSYALARLLADPALSLFGLCEFLQDVGHKLEDSV